MEDLKGLVLTACMLQEGRKEILLMRATAEVYWHVNVRFEQINNFQTYRDRQ